MSTKKDESSVVDYRAGKVPAWVREAIEAHLAIEAEDAKSAGELGYMARALVSATMPYRDPKTDVFVRQNGDFKLRILAGYEGGIPYGIYPRLLMSWVTTEAVVRQSPEIELGDSLNGFLRNVLDLGSSGGRKGSTTRVSEQMRRLFGSLVTAQYDGKAGNGRFVLRNILIAEGLELDSAEAKRIDDGVRDPVPSDAANALWTPQAKSEAGTWRSRVRLSTAFFQECVERPVPIDLRAYKALRGSPMAMDAYTWLTYRASYARKRTAPIPWGALMMQFGSGYSAATDHEQAVRNFKRDFLKALRAVQVVYPGAKFSVEDRGLVLIPSKPHIAIAGPQQNLF